MLQLHKNYIPKIYIYVDIYIYKIYIYIPKDHVSDIKNGNTTEIKIWHCDSLM